MINILKNGSLVSIHFSSFFSLIRGKYLLFLLLALPLNAQNSDSNSRKGCSVTEAVTIKVEVNKPSGKLNPFWAWFGHNEPNYSYMKDGKKLLSELAALSLVPVFVRAHYLMTSGDGTSTKKAKFTHFRVNSEHRNSYKVWKKMGSLQNPTPEQYVVLENAGQLELLSEPEYLKIIKNMADTSFQLTRQAV